MSFYGDKSRKRMAEKLIYSTDDEAEASGSVDKLAQETGRRYFSAAAAAGAKNRNETLVNEDSDDDGVAMAAPIRRKRPLAAAASTAYNGSDDDIDNDDELSQRPSRKRKPQSLSNWQEANEGLEEVRVTSKRTYDHRRDEENARDGEGSGVRRNEMVGSMVKHLKDVWEQVRLNVDRTAEDHQREREKFTNARRKLTTAAIDLAEMDEMYVESCWSLVDRLNRDTFKQQFRICDDKVKLLLDTLNAARRIMFRVRDASQNVGVPTRFNFRKNATSNEETDDGIDDGDNIDEIFPRNWLNLTQHVDDELHTFCRFLAARSGDIRALGELENRDNFASVNDIVNDEHLSYLCSKIDYSGQYRAKKTSDSKHPIRHTLVGLFLVSLFETKSTIGNFSSWIDAKDHLRKVVQTFVDKYILNNGDAANMRVFVNISAKMKTPVFHVLDPSTDVVGTGSNGDAIGFQQAMLAPRQQQQQIQGPASLGLVQLAYAALDTKRNIISVKAYLVCRLAPKI